MDKKTALEVLEQVARLAQKGGLLQLDEVPTVLQALEVLKEKDEE